MAKKAAKKKTNGRGNGKGNGKGHGQAHAQGPRLTIFNTLRHLLHPLPLTLYSTHPNY